MKCLEWFVFGFKWFLLQIAETSYHIIRGEEKLILNGVRFLARGGEAVVFREVNGDNVLKVHFSNELRCERHTIGVPIVGLVSTNQISVIEVSDQDRERKPFHISRQRYMNGGDLLGTREPLPAKKLLFIVRNILNMFRYFEERRILICDTSFENWFCQVTDGVISDVLLGDFTIVQDRKHNPDNPRHYPPEYCDGYAYDNDNHAWSAGIVMMYLVYGSAYGFEATHRFIFKVLPFLPVEQNCGKRKRSGEDPPPKFIINTEFESGLAHLMGDSEQYDVPNLKEVMRKLDEIDDKEKEWLEKIIRSLLVIDPKSRYEIKDLPPFPTKD